MLKSRSVVAVFLYVLKIWPYVFIELRQRQPNAKRVRYVRLNDRRQFVDLISQQFRVRAGTAKLFHAPHGILKLKVRNTRSLI